MKQGMPSERYLKDALEAIQKTSPLEGQRGIADMALECFRMAGGAAGTTATVDRRNQEKRHLAAIILAGLFSGPGPRGEDTGEDYWTIEDVFLTVEDIYEKYPEVEK